MCTAAGDCAAAANCVLTADGKNGATATDKCGLFTAFTKPAVGDVGDEVGVLIWNKTATKKIPGIRIGRRVTAVTNCVQDTTVATTGNDDAVAL